MSSKPVAVVEKGRTFAQADDRAIAIRPGAGLGAYAALVAQLFARDAPRRLVALASIDGGEGVSAIVARLSDEVSRTVGVTCSVVTASELLAASGQRNGVVRASGGYPAAMNRPGELAVESDYVLVDGGSLASGEILGIASRVDAIVLVVEAGKTRRRALTQGISTITAAGGRVAGLILNRRRRALPRWLERLLD